jgi:MFS family permease
LSRSHRLLVATVASSLLLGELFFSALAPLLPDYIAQHGLSQAEVGLFVATEAIGSVVAVPFAAWAVGRFGARRTMVGGLLAFGAAGVLFGLSQTVWQLDLTRGAIGVASTFAWAAGFTWLAQAIPPGRRARSIGLVVGAASAGALLGPGLGIVALHAGTGATFGLVAAICVALALAMLRLPAPEQRDAIARSLLRDRMRRQTPTAWWRLAWIVVLPALVWSVLLVQVPVRLDEVGFGAAAIGLVFMGTSLLDTALSPLVGWWADRRGRAAPLRGGTLLIGVGAALATVLGQTAAVVMLTLAIASGAMLLAAPTLALLADRFEALELPYEVAFAGQTLGWAVGHLAGALGSGLLAGVGGSGAPFAVLAALALATRAGLARGWAAR